MHDPPTWESTKSDSLTKETQADCLQMVIACDSVPLNVDLSSIAVGKKKLQEPTHKKIHTKEM